MAQSEPQDHTAGDGPINLGGFELSEPQDPAAGHEGYVLDFETIIEEVYGPGHPGNEADG